VSFIAGRPSLGDSSDYNRFEAGAVGVQTIKRWTGLLKVVGGSGLGTDIPIYSEFFLGGLFRLSGRPQEQLSGNTYALATGLLYYRLSNTSGLIVKNLSVGVSIEGGNTWAFDAPVSFSGFKSAGSVFVVADTILGPFFVGYGRSGSFSSAYLYLNRAF
jgi:NTE family protein